jgi:hypothetical protein
MLAANKTDCMNFVVCKLNQFSVNTFGCGLRTTNYRVSISVDSSSAGQCDIVDISGGRLTYNRTNVVGTPYLIAAYRDGVNEAVYFNGVSAASKSNASGVAASETGTLKLLAGVNFGHLGEAIHVARYDATDFAATTSYLRTKWGV